MIIDPSALDAEATYRLLTGIVVPRPIAWVSTRSADGIVNLAPFSAFTMVSNSPPIVGINVGARAGSRKDTARNIHETNEFVINIPTWDMRSTVHDSSREFAPHINEADELGLELIDSDLIKSPRLVDTPISLECELDRIVEFGDSGSEFIAGRIVRFHIRDNIYENGKIDTRLLDPAARIAGPSYSRVKVVDTLAPIALSPKITKSKNGGVSV